MGDLVKSTIFAQSIACMTRNQSSMSYSPSKAPIVSLNMKHYPHCW